MRNLVDTLIIVPRMIICKKFKKYEPFTQTITIKNKGLVRILAYNNDLFSFNFYRTILSVSPKFNILYGQHAGYKYHISPILGTYLLAAGRNI